MDLLQLLQQALNFVAPYVANFAQAHPYMAVFFGVVGFVRAINKPLFVFVHSVVAATATPKDDDILNKVESSKFYKAFCFALDWIFSIKIGTQAPQAQK